MYRLRFQFLFVIMLGALLPAMLLAETTPTASQSVLEAPFGDSTSQQEPILIVATVIQVLLGFVGAATLLVFIWGGFHLIFSGGNEEKITKGKSTLVWAVIGLAIILSSYAILQYTFNTFKTVASG